jgi:hypothetical protein
MHMQVDELSWLSYFLEGFESSRCDQVINRYDIVIAMTMECSEMEGLNS